MTTQADFVELALGATETTETTLGTISIPVTGVKHIVGIYGITSVITTTGESAYGYFRLAFKTVPGVFRFPTTIFSNPAGTLASPLATGSPQIIPVDILVPANESVTCIMALHAVATGACRGMIGLIFE
jgi:hypothetical protein